MMLAKTMMALAGVLQLASHGLTWHAKAICSPRESGPILWRMLCSGFPCCFEGSCWIVSRANHKQPQNLNPSGVHPEIAGTMLPTAGPTAATAMDTASLAFLVGVLCGPARAATACCAALALAREALNPHSAKFGEYKWLFQRSGLMASCSPCWLRP